jgi:hypothetical protein
MISQNQVLECLQTKIGIANATKALELVREIKGKVRPEDDRAIRKIVKELRRHGYPIASAPNLGYFWAETPEELQMARDWIRGRAMCSLVVARNMIKRGMPKLTGQMSIDDVDDFLEVKAEANVTLLFEIPESLNQAMRQFLIENSNYSCDQLVVQALQMFLRTNRS